MGQYVGIGALPFFDISPLFKGMSLHMYIFDSYRHHL